MNTQKNLMMFTIVISVIYGIWAIFAPAHIMSTYGTPEEFVNPVVMSTMMLFGVSAWVVAILGWHIRATVTEENVEKAMGYFAINWLLYGLHGVFSEKIINLAGRDGTSCLFKTDHWRNSFPRFQCCLFHAS